MLLVVLVVSFVFLGRWQWSRAMSTSGGPQNLIYALQWWTFAGVIVYGWWRMVRDELHPVTPAAPMAAYNDYLAWLSANPRR